jgi:hypothetical protein
VSTKLYTLKVERDFKTFNPETQYLIWALTERKSELSKEQRLTAKEKQHLGWLAQNLRRSPSLIEAGERLLANLPLKWSWQSHLQIILSDCLHPFHTDSYFHSIRIPEIIIGIQTGCDSQGFANFPDFGNREFANLKYKLIPDEEYWGCIINAAYYHDLGKLGYPTGFWDTPGKFSPLQKKCRKSHPALFFPLGEMFAVPLNVTVLAIGHHYLNLHYPDNGLIKLFQDMIYEEKFKNMLEILTTLDVYDGMRGKRQYHRETFSHQKVIDKMPRELGSIGTKYVPFLEFTRKTGMMEVLYPC